MIDELILNYKNKNMNRKTLRLYSTFILSLFFLLFLQGCNKDDDNNNNTNTGMYTISATMTSAQEVPVNSSTGTGTVTGTYNSATNSLTYNVSWSGLTGTATLGHFHGPALAGATASPVISFTLVNNANAGTASNTVVLTDAQEADLLAGKWYANIHTSANGGGEIRGQVTVTL